MLQTVMFHVPGRPQGKARARTFYNSKARVTKSITPENTVLYENLIKEMYMKEANGNKIGRESPVVLRIVARFEPPQSVSKKRRSAMLDGEELPLKKPDIDNIVKVVADALNGVAYHDDKQVVSVVANKVYSALEGLDVTVEEYIDTEGR